MTAEPSEMTAAMARAQEAWAARHQTDTKGTTVPDTTTTNGQREEAAEAITPQSQRDVALEQLLRFVGDHVVGTRLSVSISIHGLPLELFDDDGPFDTVGVRLRTPDGRGAYLVGKKHFGVPAAPGCPPFEVTAFSRDIRTADTSA